MEQMRWVFIVALAGSAYSGTGERETVEWFLREGAAITIAGAAQPVRHLVDLPSGDVTVIGLDLTATHAT